MSRWSKRVWVAGSAAVVLLALFELLRVASGGADPATLAQRDFANLWAGAKLIAAGDWATLYTRAAFTRYEASLVGAFGPRAFSYPPTGFLLVLPFGFLPYGFAFAAWFLASGGFFLRAARAWWPEGAGPRWLVLLMPAALLNAWLGHFGFVWGGLWLAAFALLPTRPVAAGLVIGLLAMKPQLAVLIPLVLLLRREWRAIGAAAAGTAATVAVSLVLWGAEPWRAFVTRTAGAQMGYVDAHGANFAKLSTSAATALFEMGAPAAVAWGVQACFALLGLALLVRAARAPLERLAPLAATATFLVLPYALAYDLTAVSVGALALMVDPSARRGERVLGGLGFIAPQLGIVAAMLGAPVMPLLLAGLAWGQYRAARQALPDRQTPRRPGPFDAACGVAQDRLEPGQGCLLPSAR